MSFDKGLRLPGQSASKLGHLAVIQSKWVQSLVEDFESSDLLTSDPSGTIWTAFNAEGVPSLRNIWAVDGSFVAVKTEQKPSKEVAFVKTALLMLDKAKLDAIDKEHPHPLLLREILANCGIQHSTVFPLRNVRTKLGHNLDAVRHIIRDSFKVDQGGAFYETLKWLAYRKWEQNPNTRSPGFECPCCGKAIKEGLPYNADEASCLHCDGLVFLSDICGFHLEMDEDSAPDSVASSYMLVMEHLMLFTAIRLMWHHTDRQLVSDTLFIKDGPLTLRGQYSKLVPNIRLFFEFAKQENRLVHVIGLEKSGAFRDHLNTIVHFTSPLERGEPMAYACLSHSYVRREVYRSPALSNPYGFRTNWGEKLYVKLDPGMHMVLNIPVGRYLEDVDHPVDDDLIGLRRILATIPSIVSHKYEGALYPVELADGIASMSSYPSAAILQRFVSEQSR
ncbi:hypothetical protein [Laribacter hongkongensis]|uniref:NurA domain-containing protein n=1 Tax=Laribacter hongkongensis TaxID=168471 RepID=A0A248LJW5_9NEIS|nr:hypothetical protein [Laribacter hongkongensis]ASJ24781.1 hypothetical protein LHGZ1_1950 [Laribacter hongkongensis]MCG9040559.1 hypothetical protein [Laribacter hongkongensis]MCG9067159.1 hypothetical protein [Laribacter hongkongensis]MCG9087973.1 hypothetical protein [Laribacter hongkongensis]MCG9110502.1 hypothetical protein [Laribacter hongkongensis]